MKDSPQKVIDSALKTLKAGIISLLETEPMFAQILMNLEYVPAPVGTCAVDGKRFLYEPGFLAKQTINNRKFIIAHEACHQAFLHPFQMRDMLKANPKFDLRLANIAMDYVINALLKFTGWRLPYDTLYDKRFTHEMEWVQVYRILKSERESDERDNAQNNPIDKELPSKSKLQSPSQSEDNSDQNSRQKMDANVEQSDEESDKEIETIPNECKEHANGGVIPAQEDMNEEATAKQNISQAIQISQLAGKIHSGLRRKLEEVFDIVESPWEILQDCISRETVGDKTYKRPSRRTIDSGFMLPSFEKDFEIENGVFAFDVSGSVNQDMMNHFWKHGTNIISEYSGNVFAVFCDAVLPEENINAFDCDSIPESLPTFEGGGGTAFKPVFQWIEEEEMNPDFLIYFTDMCSCDLKELQEPDYPVFWLVWNSSWKKERTPFGETIDISSEKY